MRCDVTAGRVRLRVCVCTPLSWFVCGVLRGSGPFKAELSATRSLAGLFERERDEREGARRGGRRYSDAASQGIKPRRKVDLEVETRLLGYTVRERIRGVSRSLGNDGQRIKESQSDRQTETFEREETPRSGQRQPDYYFFSFGDYFCIKAEAPRRNG